MPARVTTKPAIISVRCANRFASLCWGEDDARLDRVVAPYLLQEYGDDERDAHEKEPLDVLGHQGEVAGAIPEQPGREQRLLPCALAPADVQEEPGQKHEPHDETDDEQRVGGAGLQDAEDNEEHP